MYAEMMGFIMHIIDCVSGVGNETLLPFQLKIPDPEKLFIAGISVFRGEFRKGRYL